MSPEPMQPLYTRSGPAPAGAYFLIPLFKYIYKIKKTGHLT